jgi:replicative DNA helicase
VGCKKSDLIIFAGRPGMGKTSFMLSLALNAAQQFDARVLIFTLEMGVEQMIQRMVSMETGINMQRLRTGQFDDAEQRRLVEALGRLSQHRIFIDDSPSLTPIQMRTKCQRVNYEHGLDLVILDYLQLMHAPGYEGNRVQEISYISRQMKELARELNVPLLSAAQLSRAVEQRADKRPQLSDLRESGSIEQDSDIVMFLYRDIVYNEATENPNQADVIVAKHRNGPTDTIPLYFDATITRFQDGTRQHVDLSAM